MILEFFFKLLIGIVTIVF